MTARNSTQSKTGSKKEGSTPAEGVSFTIKKYFFTAKRVREDIEQDKRSGLSKRHNSTISNNLNINVSDVPINSIESGENSKDDTIFLWLFSP